MLQILVAVNPRYKDIKINFDNLFSVEKDNQNFENIILNSTSTENPIIAATNEIIGTDVALAIGKQKRIEYSSMLPPPHVLSSDMIADPMSNVLELFSHLTESHTNEEDDELCEEQQPLPSIITPRSPFLWNNVDDSLGYIIVDIEKSSSKLAIFDLDGTLITTKSGSNFSNTPDDWQFIFPVVKDKLNQLENDGYNILCFTNQMGIGDNSQKKIEFEVKAEKIITSLGLKSLKLYYSRKNDNYRKGNIGMWEYFLANHNHECEIDKSKCFYVGDAAGRPTDFSNCDKLFAQGIGVDFILPEVFFSLNDLPISSNSSNWTCIKGHKNENNNTKVKFFYTLLH